MAIEVKDGRYFSRFLLGDLPGGSLLGAVFRDEDDDDWTLLFRLRIFRDDDNDHQQWWSVAIRNRTQIRADFEAKRALTNVSLELGGGGDIEEIVIDSDDPLKVAEVMSRNPNLHMTSLSNAKA